MVVLCVRSPRARRTPGGLLALCVALAPACYVELDRDVVGDAATDPVDPDASTDSGLVADAGSTDAGDAGVRDGGVQDAGETDGGDAHDGGGLRDGGIADGGYPAPYQPIADVLVFESVGVDQTWTIPEGVDSARFELWAAAGGAGGIAPNLSAGGAGGFVSIELVPTATPSTCMIIQVGASGASGATPPFQAYPRGGRGNDRPGHPTGGGGGRSAIVNADGHAEIGVAGAGGGAGSALSGQTAHGGGGGGTEGNPGGAASNQPECRGGGGTQVAGGTSPDANSTCASRGQAGGRARGGDSYPYGGPPNTNTSNASGGGGDGYYGGGAGGHHSGGGGGSSYVDSRWALRQFIAPPSPTPSPAVPPPATHPNVATAAVSMAGGPGLVRLELTLRDVVHATCGAYRRAGAADDGLYLIDPDGAGGAAAFTVFCDMTTDGGGWTVMQQRSLSTDPVEFYRVFRAYEIGFGCPGGEHWLGLERIHALTSMYPMRLRVELTKGTATSTVAEYSRFAIGSSTTSYALDLGGSVVSGPDGLFGLDGVLFSARDVDNDPVVARSCAQDHRGGWWFGVNCGYSNPNGMLGDGPGDVTAASWQPFTTAIEPVSATRMMLREW